MTDVNKEYLHPDKKLPADHPIKVEMLRERAADYYQAEFYRCESGFNDVFDFYAMTECLSDEELDEHERMFRLEQASGVSAPHSHMHTIVSDLCWKLAQRSDVQSLIEFFAHKL